MTVEALTVQREFGLVAEGIVGPRTRHLLDSISRRRPKQR
jgi:murein L,D-transpeptidase YcbB/YkuD